MRQDAVQTAADVSLLMKLQRRVSELEKENMDLQSEMDTKEEQLQLERTKVISVVYFRMAQFITHVETMTQTKLCMLFLCILRNWKIVREY